MAGSQVLDGHAQSAEAMALEAGLPSHVALPIHASNDDQTSGICIWEGIGSVPAGEPHRTDGHSASWCTMEGSANPADNE
jgi:hypothetical protein